MHGRFVRTYVGFLVGALALAGCGGQRSNASEAATGRLSIATGNTTGVYYVMGGGFAQIINAHLDGYRATAEATGGSVENIQRIANGQSDIGLSPVDTATDAVRGTAPFTSPQPIRAIARVYNNYTHVVVRTDAGIDRIEDLKGKVVGTGSPGAGTIQAIARRLLAVSGLNLDTDVTQQRLSLPESTDAIAKGKIQALFWSGGLPTAGIKELFGTAKGKVKILDLSPYLAKMQSQYTTLYQAGTIPKGTYGTSADIPTIVVPNLILVRDTMSNDLAYRLTKLLFDYKADLVATHKEANNLDLSTAQLTGEVLLHDGAKKYYGQH
ncbi:MAG: TAXI family TRAP transporter solute-binding subunit [Actinobacteria bacterium]|nr:TAXI family TRAP transporter solute-binding subunit [Actinomycetota bacterium]